MSGQSRDRLNPVFVVLVLIVVIGIIGGLMVFFSEPPPPSPIHVTPAAQEFGPVEPPPPPKTPEDKARDREICLSHLRAINKAIQAYRRDHPDARTRGFPEELRDLVGEYLNDPAVLLCPADESPLAKQAATGVIPVNSLGTEFSSYMYLVSPAIPDYRDPMYGCENCTWYDWLDRRGNDAPLMICPHHTKLPDPAEAGTIGPFFIVRLNGKIDIKRVPLGPLPLEY